MRMTITNRMMMGASLLMMTFSFATKTNAETCTQVPTCAELGFTETNCGSKKALKCPFDQTKLFCAGEKCPAGYIYYSDNTCSENYTSGKTVVGVVAGEGIIVNIVNAGSTMTWENAISHCKGVSRGGKTAHLPTFDEGRKIANNSVAVNSGLAKISGASALTYQYYWSSTEFDTTRALNFYPLNALTPTITKTDTSNVRCVFDF